MVEGETLLVLCLCACCHSAARLGVGRQGLHNESMRRMLSNHAITIGTRLSISRGAILSTTMNQKPLFIQIWRAWESRFERIYRTAAVARRAARAVRSPPV